MTKKKGKKVNNRVFVLSSGEKIAFIVKGRPHDVLYVKNVGDTLAMATGGNPVCSIHETLRQKVVSRPLKAVRETYSRIIAIEAGESLEITVPKYRNKNHVYVVERGGKLALVNGTSLVSRIAGEGLHTTAA